MKRTVGSRLVAFAGKVASSPAKPRKARTWPDALVAKVIRAAWDAYKDREGLPAEYYVTRRAGEGARGVLDMLVREGWTPPARRRGKGAR